MCDTLELKKSNAIQAYDKGTADQKRLLEELYGKEVFSRKITDRVKSFEDACGVLGISVASVLSGYDTKDEAAYKKLRTIARALNDGWQPDWNNNSQYKYYPYFDMQNGFSFRHVNINSQGSLVGSRLCFRSREIAEYAGVQFTDLYKKYFEK